MSTEKLSELSKPVAEIRKHYQLGIDAPASAFFQPLEGLSAVNFGDLLYSQEYVSALKRESAVNWEAAASLNVENQELKKRIAELEAKLATPVRLPDTRQSVSGDRYQWSDGALNYKQDAIALLREQGFIIDGGE
ncbi:TPA: hypothetical protein ACKP17_000362 [Serratia marcescens]